MTIFNHSSEALSRMTVGWIVSIFLLLSGSSALIYQVLWVRLLSLSIGSTSISISTVLAAFFLGLGLGSYFAGHILQRFKNAFKIYLFVEIGIALSALSLLPILLDLDYYLSILPITEAGLGLKFFVVMLLLLIPTFLIGTTFPILVAVAILNKDGIGNRLAHFYAFNTLGAVTGALLSGFVLIPYFGLDGTLYIAASINAFIVFAGLLIYRRIISSSSPLFTSSAITEKDDKFNIKALIVLFVTGFVAMATEVGWMKFLIVYTGNTIYGFSLILSMFLVGIALGSYALKLRVFSSIEAKKMLFFGLILLSVMLLAARVGLGVFSDIYEQLNTLEVDAFVYRWSKYLVMFLLLLPATALFGALFPVALKLYSADSQVFYSHVGKAYAINIIAGVFGSVIAGFWIIPYFSTDVLLSAGALVILFSSLLFVNDIKSKNIFYIWSSFTIIFVFISTYLPHIDYRSMINIVVQRDTKHASAHVKSTIHYLKEGQTGIIGILSYDNYPCIKRLFNNGMNESWVDICDADNLLLNEFLLGEIPLLLNPLAKKAFVVGYGGGTTVKALAMNELERIDVVELDSAVLDAMRTLYDNKLPTDEDKRVHVTINDARNTLLMSDNTYDVIVSQPSHPWLSGASNVMNRDFFEIVKSRLSPNGINAQWVPLFKIDVATFKSIIKAYTDTFEYVISFVDISTRDFIMFGSNQPIVFDYERIQKQMQVPQIKRVLQPHNIENSYDLIRHFALSREELVAISASAISATDKNVLAETFNSRFYDIQGNSFDTVGFLKSNFSHDMSSYLKN
ncbi:MAG: fused MFS/spermidine synthase [Sulfurimonas sp.]|nr:fused MFS/spermidine synthase [Sulfurimonas sp.]